jgi:pentatricopeptide repeat protein
VKCGDLEQAQSLFDASTNKVLSMYTVMMHGFNKDKHPQKTLNLLNQMKIDGIDPNFKIYTCVIQALSKIGDYSMCEAIIKQIPDSCLTDRSIQNALIDMWVCSKKLNSHLFFYLKNEFREKLVMSIVQEKFLRKTHNQIKLDMQR